MEQFNEEKGLYGLVLAELKSLGVKVPKVKKLKAYASKQDKVSNENGHRIFGASLSDQEWITDSDSDCPLPKFVVAATDYLKGYTEVEVGLFRKAGSIVRQRELRAKLEEGGNFLNCEPNDVASLLKQWLRELPEPVIPMYLHDLFLRCQSLDCDEDRLNATLLSCLLLPSEHLYTLKHLLKFLYGIAANSDVNKMSVHNLAVIMAPNLLPCGGNNVNKSSNIVQSYTSLVEMLIDNANKVGSVPQKIADQLMSEESSDFPIDTLDCSPHKLKKKVRNAVGGGNVVIDLVSGIKKIVGGNVTPSTFLDVSDAHIMKSSTRRKNRGDNTSETPFFTPVAKISRLAAPMNGINSNTPLSHFRRKSFGLLNKKNRKRAKSGMKQNNNLQENKGSTSQAKNTPSTPTVVVFNTVVVNHKESEKTHDGLTVSLDIKTLPSCASVHSTSIKRSVSDFPLSTNKVESRKRCSNSLSTGHLPAKRPSPMHPQSNINVKRKSSRNKTEHDLNKGTVEQYVQKGKDSCYSVILKKDECQETVIRKTENGRQEMKRNSSSRHSSRTGNRRMSAGGVAIKADQDSSSVHKRPSQSGSKKRSSSGKIRHKNSKNSNREDTMQKTNVNIVDVFVHTPVKTQEEYQENASTPMNVEKQSLPGSIRKNLNKSSLKRGRPNTIKTGLPSVLCPKYSNDLSSKLERSVTFEGSKSFKALKSEEHSEASEVTIHTPDIFDNSISDLVFSISGKDDSLNCMFKPESFSNSIEHAIEVLKDSPCESVVVPPDLSMKKSPICPVELPEFTSVNANSKEKIKPCKQATECNTHIAKSPCYKVNENVETENWSNDIVKSMDFGNCSEDLASDKENFYPGKEIWHTEAENFLNAHLAPKESHCKRESIIQIITNNSGKVKQNIQHYNHIAKDKHHESFNNSRSNSCSTPRREVRRTLTEISFSPNVYDTRSFVSPRMCTRSCSQNLPSNVESSITRSKSKRSVKSPLPPPPKFVLSDIDKNTPSTPLKEVTNIRSGTKNSNSKNKVIQITKSPSHIKKITPLSEGSKSATDSNEKNSVVKRCEQRSRLSYEGDVPARITKENRSESSPILAKRNHNYSLRLKESSQSPLLRKRFHSQSFTSPCDLPRTVSTVSIRDIDDLKNMHLVDAWECKM